jgi:hypothetical protein
LTMSSVRRRIGMNGWLLPAILSDSPSPGKARL